MFRSKPQNDKILISVNIINNVVIMSCAFWIAMMCIPQIPSCMNVGSGSSLKSVEVSMSA